MVEPRVKQEEWVSPTELKERVFLDLPIDDDDGGEGGPELLVVEESSIPNLIVIQINRWIDPKNNRSTGLQRH
jgi:hypothetical protein